MAKVEQRVVWKKPLNEKTGLPDENGIIHSEWMNSRDIKKFLAERPFIQKFVSHIQSKHIACDHYWLIRRGGYCCDCKKAFNIFHNGFYTTEV